MTSSESDKDDSSTSDSSLSSDDEGANDVQGDFTPYQRPKVKDGRTFPALSAMSPTTRPRLEDARSRYSIWLATHDAFPSEKEARRAARGAMLTELNTVHRSCADESDVEEQQRVGRRVSRFHKQPSYKKDTTAITEGVDSTFRGHIVYDAESLVAAEWKLDDLNEEECREKVQNLLHKGNFAFADWEGEKECLVVRSFPSSCARRSSRRLSRKVYRSV
ncbi:hypothetical protein EXIGLDRAFT_517728 [Exidia glandulosa HHB12029]|uniref:DUF6532 domain-containing protein n=1 Tax=Exidia glandulosa HHB12029 TaxID=1314781 RepID=A0A166N2G5_EXIGL|nr:hypothetical protein EXIGLDRAFT_517728 [Exidia glandulosa HHB12029]